MSITQKISIIFKKIPLDNSLTTLRFVGRIGGNISTFKWQYHNDKIYFSGIVDYAIITWLMDQINTHQVLYDISVPTGMYMYLDH